MLLFQTDLRNSEALSLTPSKIYKFDGKPLIEHQLLILDDWLRNRLAETQTNDILEIVGDRYNHSSTMVVTQIPVAKWHEQFANPTLADAIMDRIVHNAYRLELRGESMRKRKSFLTYSGHGGSLGENGSQDDTWEKR